MSEDSVAHQSRRLDLPLSQPDIVPAARLQSADEVGKRKKTNHEFKLDNALKTVQLLFMQTSVQANFTDLLLICPEVKKEIDNEFHQPLLHNCMSETGSEAKLSLDHDYNV